MDKIGKSCYTCKHCYACKHKTNVFGLCDEFEWHSTFKSWNRKKKK